MDAATFKNIVTAVGENKVLAIVFDNSARELFLTRNFSMTKYWIESLGCFKFEEKTVTGTTFDVYKAVTDVQAVITGNATTKYDELDSRLLSS